MSGGLKKIIIVDDNNTNLTLCKKVLRPFYEVYPVPSAKKMFDLLNNIIPDLILLDVDMPDLNGYEAAGMLKKNEAHKGIPIIFISGRVDPTSEIFGMNMGALDYIHKPFVSELLIRRIKTYLSLVDYQKMLEEKAQAATQVKVPLEKILSILEEGKASQDPAFLQDCLSRAALSAVELHALCTGAASA